MPDAPLGLFGGTFDPVHFGHLRLAEEARETLGLAKVIWIPAGQPPLRDAPGRSAADRLAMVRLAVAGNPGFTIDDGEVVAAGTSYTVNTLERLRAAHGERQPLVLLLGADAFGRLDAWHRWRELFGLAHIAVATRPGHALGVGPGGSCGVPPRREVRAGGSCGVPPGPKVSPGGTAPDAGERGWAPDLCAEYAARHGCPADLAESPAGRIVPFTMSGLEISATALRGHFAAGTNPRYLAPDAVLDYIDRHHLYRNPQR